MNKFVGCYKAIHNSVLRNEVGLLKVSNTKNDTLCFTAKDAILNEVKTPVDFVLDGTQTFIRWDGALVQEQVGKTLFGLPSYDAQVIKKKWNGNLVRTVYENYEFKGLFGGYWFPTEKTVHVWKPCEHCNF
jgi:hypothetical protein